MIKHTSTYIEMRTMVSNVAALAPYLDWIVSGGPKAINKLYDGMSLLHLAVRGNHTAAVELLLSKNADINLQDYMGRTPLVTAIEEGHTALATSLLEQGADPTIAEFAELHGQHYSGDNALHYAIKFKDEGAATKILAVAIIDPSLDANIANLYGQTPASLAAASGDDELIQIFAAHESAVIGDTTADQLPE